ncbi:uncharacterized protein [Maniola hyperantus]|uniref:uncharacterized protein n=1 Tax=Aphantopus hyperantus TaxID=2795564 RepID=UPI00374825EE
MIRTPKKLPEESSPPPTPPNMENKSVRQSLEKWEAAAAKPTTSKAQLTQAAPTVLKLTLPPTSKAQLTQATHAAQKQSQPSASKAQPTQAAPAVQKQATQKGGKSPRKVTTAVVRRSVTATFKNRVEEAEALTTKGKTAVGQSRNLKAEYKDTILSVLDALERLVTESEAALEAGNAQTGGGASREVAPATTSADATFRVASDPDLSQQLEEHSRLLLENNTRMRALQEQLTKTTEVVETQQRSYANVTATRVQQPVRPVALHSVVVTSKDDKETGEEVLGRVRKTIDAKDGWVRVERVRKAKDRKVIMGFGTAEERNKAKDRLVGEGTGLVVEDIKNRDPLLILRGVLSVNTDDDITKALRNQNRELFGGLDHGDDRIQIKYRKRARNPHMAHVVISTSPTLWSRITGLGSVHIDLQRVRAEDQSPLVQCTRCLGYGHGRKFCKDSVDLCSHCGGPHLRPKCAEWLAGSPPSCRNCCNAKLDNVEHNVFSEDCPVRKRWDDLARSTVAYC